MCSAYGRPIVPSCILVYTSFYPGFVMHGFSYWISACCAWIGLFPKEAILVLPREYLLSISIWLSLTSHYRILTLLLSVICSLVLAFLLFCPFLLLPFFSFQLSPSHHLSPSAPASHLKCLNFPLFLSLPLPASIAQPFFAFSLTPQIHHVSETPEINVGLCMDGF